MSTVRDILGRNAHRYRPETQSLVMETARTLGYRPNAAARAMAKGGLRAVGLLVRGGDNRSRLHSATLDGLEDEAARRGLTLVISRAAEASSAKDDVRASRIYEESLVDGLIAMSDVPPEQVSAAAQSKPVVLMNEREKYDAVFPDDEGAAAKATGMLIERGCLNVVFANYSKNPHFSSADRREGYTTAMRAAKREPAIIIPPTGIAKDDWVSFTADWLTVLEPPVGVLCYGTATALPIVHALARYTDWPLPSHGRVVAFAYGHAFEYDALPMAYLEVPQYRLGVEAVAMLAEKIASPGRRVRSRLVPYQEEGRRFPAGWYEPSLDRPRRPRRT